MKNVQTGVEKIIANVEKVIIGKRDAIELMLINLLSQGHLLIEDVPGVGKTMMARSLACSIGGSFSRMGVPAALYIGELVGAVLMFIGFLRATTPMGESLAHAQPAPAD